MRSFIRSRLILATAILALSAVAPAVYAADPLPTMDEIKQMVKDEKFKELTPILSRAVSLKGPDAEQYPKRELYEIKGEVALRTKSKQGAADAYAAAAKATDKPDEAAADTGMALLIKAAGANLKYTPKPPKDKDKDKPEPIDIVDVDSRKKALSALARDMLAVREPKVTAVVKGNDQSQLVAEGKELVELRDVEIAQTGAPTDSKQLMGDLGSRSAKLLSDQADQLGKNLQDELDIFQNANSGKGAAAGHSQAAVSMSQLGHDATACANNAKSLDAQSKTLSTVFGEVADFKVVDQKIKQLITGANNLAADVKRHGG